MVFIIIFGCLYGGADAQERSIEELAFLIGKWETREESVENGWWETSVREITYSLKGNYIQLNANAIDSKGNQREYSWFINYNKKNQRFEMVSMFSNWYKTQFDILDWDSKQRKLTIRNQPSIEGEFHERYGEIIFNEAYDEYVWKGENKYGDINNPSIWKYIEKGARIN